MSEEQTTKLKKHRSRNFPAFDLEKAVEQVRTLKNRERSNWTPTSVAIECWGFSPKSSGGMRTLSALIQYGLLEETGTGKDRRIRVAALAVNILDNPDTTERLKSIQEAALKPDLYREICDKYSGQLPSDGTLRWELSGKGEPQKGALNEKSVDQFINSFRSTLAFAELTKDGIVEPANGDKTPEIDEDATKNRSDSASSSEGGHPMPSTNMPTRTDFDLPIQLGAGLQGTLRLPNPMTSEEWERFESAIESAKQLRTFLVNESTKDPDEGC